jgi:hypothetical protein
MYSNCMLCKWYSVRHIIEYSNFRTEIQIYTPKRLKTVFANFPNLEDKFAMLGVLNALRCPGRGDHDDDVASPCKRVFFRFSNDFVFGWLSVQTRIGTTQNRREREKGRK